jgi:putative glutathione S-transferase
MVLYLKGTFGVAPPSLPPSLHPLISTPSSFYLFKSSHPYPSLPLSPLLPITGLDNVISISIAHPTWARTRNNDELDHHTGWVFRSPTDPPLSSPTGWGKFPCDVNCIPDFVNGARSVRELYDLSRDTEGKYTVPVLWDKRTGTIVNNESGDILKMLNENFNFLAMNPTLNLKPFELAKAVDQYNVWLHENINDGVYKCGFATSQAAYEEAVEGVVGAMDHAEALLGRQRYLLGDRLTEADIRLFVTLVRFDEVRREGGREGGLFCLN